MTVLRCAAILLCGQILSMVYGQGQQLVSPCPNVFTYEENSELEAKDRWHGVISYSSDVELSGLNVKVQLDKPAQLFVTWDHEARTRNNTFYNLFNPYHLQKANEVVKVRIMVKFNTSQPVPTIKKIIINGRTQCNVGGGSESQGDRQGGGQRRTTEGSGGGGWSTERPDPVLEGERIDYNAELGTRGQEDSDSDNVNFRPLSISGSSRRPPSSPSSSTSDGGSQINSNGGGGISVGKTDVGQIVELLRNQLQKQSNGNRNETIILAVVKTGPHGEFEGHRTDIGVNGARYQRAIRAMPFFFI